MPMSGLRWIRYLSALEGTLRGTRHPGSPVPHQVEWRHHDDGGCQGTPGADAALGSSLRGHRCSRSRRLRPGLRDLITFDMGGTSADVALITDGADRVQPRGSGRRFSALLAVVGVSSIGAGGGSIAWLDGAGVLEGRPTQCGRRSRPGLLRPRRRGADPLRCVPPLRLPQPGPVRREGATRRGGGVRAAMAPTGGTSCAWPLRRRLTPIVRVALATMYTEFSAVLERRGVDPA